MRIPSAAAAALVALAAQASAQTAPTISQAEPANTVQTPIFAVPGGRPTLTLADGNFTAQPVVRLDMDVGGFWGQTRYPGGKPVEFGDSGRAGVPDPLINARRARAGVQGTYLRDFTYNFTWEFAPGPGKQFDLAKNSKLFELQTAWNGLGWGTVRAGAFTLFHTLENSGSSFESLMLERPAIINLATSLASGDTRTALGLEARGDRWFAAGYGTAGVLGTLHTGNQRGMAGRAAALAVDEAGWKVLVGGSAAAQFHPGNSPAPETVQLRDYPELRLEPTRLLDTGRIKAGSGYAAGPEVSGMVGPVHFAAEYQWIEVDANAGLPNASFRGYYANVAVPLFGGQRRYDKARGGWARPRFEALNPAANTWGFAELVARYSFASLTDGRFRGGRQEVFGVALNYYPLNRLRASIQYNNGHVTLDGPDRGFQAIGARLAFNW
jgi:phosphate-selective porin OprO/OprP